MNTIMYPHCLYLITINPASEFKCFSYYSLGGEYVADCNAVWPPGSPAQSLPAFYGGAVDTTA